MLTPEEIDRLIETMQPFIDELNDFITKDIIKRLMARLKNEELLKFSVSDVWQIEPLRETNAHFETVQKEIQRWTKKPRKK